MVVEACGEVSPGKCSLNAIKNLWEQLCCEVGRREPTACEGSWYTNEELMWDLVRNTATASVEMGWMKAATFRNMTEGNETTDHESKKRSA